MQTLPEPVPGRFLALLAPHAAGEAMLTLAARLARRGPLQVLDGGNCFNAYGAARAASQLQAAGKPTRPGQRLRLLFTLGEPGVYAWDLPDPPDPASVDLSRYTTLLLRAGSAVLGPLGLSEDDLCLRVVANARASELAWKPDRAHPKPACHIFIPAATLVK